MGRREFLNQTLLGGLALFVPRSASAADARIEVLLDETIGTVSPLLFGHFVEHLGGVVYDGIWVGEGSRIPNVGGIRSALVEALRRTRPGVVRWPGGCFADSYDWRDGISASVNGKEVVITAVNPDAAEAVEAEIVLRGARVSAARARVLTAHDLHAHNTLESPRTVEPSDQDVVQRGRSLVHRFPPASVTCLTLSLG